MTTPTITFPTENSPMTILWPGDIRRSRTEIEERPHRDSTRYKTVMSEFHYQAALTRVTAIPESAQTLLEPPMTGR